MAAIGSEEWLAELVRSAAGMPATPGVEARIATTVEKTPAGKVGWTETLVDGVTVSAEPTADKSADIVLTAQFDELVSMYEGTTDPAVLFMQGRLKLSGDMGVFLELLPALTSPEAAAARAGLAERTDRPS